MQNIKKLSISLSFLLTVFCSIQAAQPDIADFLQKNKEKSWTTTAADFQSANGSKSLYRWNSNQKQFLHYALNRTGKPLYFLKWQITEADFRFKDDKFSNAVLNIYNKSCPTNKQFAKDKNTFLKFIDELTDSLDTFCKTEHSKPSVTLINSTRNYSCDWDAPSAYIVLKWSYDGANQYNFIGQYATVCIYKDKDTFSKNHNSKASLDKEDLKALVKTDKNGDRYLEVPMVDQGARGYCVVACAERILKYYHVSIDQHILAQAASTTNFGTSSEDIEKSMKSVGAKCGFYVKEIIEFSPLIGSNKIMKFIRKYNRYAKRAGKEEIDVGKLRSYHQLIRMVDGDIMAKTTVEFDEKRFRKFKKKVEESIDDGIPLLWGVLLGIVNEKPKLRQAVGGHMRLITGYNPKTNEIIYSDSWGKGHNFKKISWEKAWAMTQMVYVFIPKKQ